MSPESLDRNRDILPRLVRSAGETFRSRYRAGSDDARKQSADQRRECEEEPRQRRQGRDRGAERATTSAFRIARQERHPTAPAQNNAPV